MGEPLNRENRVFGRLRSFEDVFPELEDVRLDYTEFDFVRETRKGAFSFRSQGGQMRCGNSRCYRGGYELDLIVHEMVGNREEQREIELHCEGDEGTAKRKVGKSCLRSIKGTIKVKRKQSAVGGGDKTPAA